MPMSDPTHPIKTHQIESWRFAGSRSGSQLVENACNVQFMAIALEADWSLIRELYTKGLPLKQITERTGVQPSTIASRASRAGWKAVAAKANEVMQSVNVQVEANEPESPKLTAQSERTRTALADVLVRSAEKLQTLALRSPGHALEVNQDAEAMVRNAAKVFGWSESSSAPAVRISIMDSAVVLSQQSQAPEQKPVIELNNAQATVSEQETVKELKPPQA